MLILFPCGLTIVLFYRYDSDVKNSSDEGDSDASDSEKPKEKKRKSSSKHNENSTKKAKVNETYKNLLSLCLYQC